jgi:hypothetical protein
MTQTTAQQIAQRLISLSLSNEAPVMELAGRRRPSFTFMAIAKDLDAKPTADLHAEVAAILDDAVATGAAV